MGQYYYYVGYVIIFHVRNLFYFITYAMSFSQSS